MKKIFILNGVGTSGKGAFAEFVGNNIPTLKYSIVDLPKEAAKVLGWGGGKTEKDRKFLSDIMDLATEYNDSPYRDVASLIYDFATTLPEEVLIIDMRDPVDITRAVKDFGAETILINNPNVKQIESNHADANVKNYEYDYIIENNGTLEQLDEVAKTFVKVAIRKDGVLPQHTYCVHSNNSGKNTIVFQCNKILR